MLWLLPLTENAMSQSMSNHKIQTHLRKEYADVQLSV